MSCLTRTTLTATTERITSLLDHQLFSQNICRVFIFFRAFLCVEWCQWYVDKLYTPPPPPQEPHNTIIYSLENALVSSFVYSFLATTELRPACIHTHTHTHTHSHTQKRTPPPPPKKTTLKSSTVRPMLTSDAHIGTRLCKSIAIGPCTHIFTGIVVSKRRDSKDTNTCSGLDLRWHPMRQEPLNSWRRCVFESAWQGQSGTFVNSADFGWLGCENWCAWGRKKTELLETERTAEAMQLRLERRRSCNMYRVLHA